MGFATHSALQCSLLFVRKQTKGRDKTNKKPARKKAKIRREPINMILLTKNQKSDKVKRLPHEAK